MESDGKRTWERYYWIDKQLMNELVSNAGLVCFGILPIVALYNRTQLSYKVALFLAENRESTHEKGKKISTYCNRDKIFKLCSTIQSTWTFYNNVITHICSSIYNHLLRSVEIYMYTIQFTITLNTLPNTSTGSSILILLTITSGQNLWKNRNV